MKLQSIPFGKKPTLKNICLPRLLAMVKEAGFVAYLSPFRSFGLLRHSGKNTGSLAVPFSITCQLNLTKPYNSVENIDKTSHFQNMANLDKSALAGAAMLGVMAVDPALAAAAEKQDANAEFRVAAITQQTQTELHNCMDRRKAGEFGKGKEARIKYRTCKREKANKRISKQEEILKEQQTILAKLDEAVRQLKMRVDKNGQILNEQGRVIAQIVAINGRLILKREQIDTQIAESKIRQQQMLDEAERILKNLAT